VEADRHISGSRFLSSSGASTSGKGLVLPIWLEPLSWFGIISFGPGGINRNQPG
jgi:hypothetical protein